MLYLFNGWRSSQIKSYDSIESMSHFSSLLPPRQSNIVDSSECRSVHDFFPGAEISFVKTGAARTAPHFTKGRPVYTIAT